LLILLLWVITIASNCTTQHHTKQKTHYWDDYHALFEHVCFWCFWLYQVSLMILSLLSFHSPNRHDTLIHVRTVMAIWNTFLLHNVGLSRLSSHYSEVIEPL